MTLLRLKKKSSKVTKLKKRDLSKMHSIQEGTEVEVASGVEEEAITKIAITTTIHAITTTIAIREATIIGQVVSSNKTKHRSLKIKRNRTSQRRIRS